jgi:DNA-binding FrmR family transcriptional regulator
MSNPWRTVNNWLEKGYRGVAIISTVALFLFTVLTWHAKIQIQDAVQESTSRIEQRLREMEARFVPLVQYNVEMRSINERLADRQEQARDMISELKQIRGQLNAISTDLAALKSKQ